MTQVEIVIHPEDFDEIVARQSDPPHLTPEMKEANRRYAELLERMRANAPEEPFVCEECEGDGWVQVYSHCPPAFGVCPSCFNPNENPCP